MELFLWMELFQNDFSLCGTSDFMRPLKSGHLASLLRLAARFASAALRETVVAETFTAGDSTTDFQYIYTPF